MATARQIREQELKNPNDPNVRDPEHAHELGGTLGMTAVGVPTAIAGGLAGVAAGAATGALSGSIAGPLGVVAGAAIGGALGGKAGEAVAREVNPTAEEKYWEEEYENRPYYVEGRDFETYRPAYRYGIDNYNRFEGKSFSEVEAELNRDWPKARGTSSLEWNEARPATEDAYNRLSARLRQDNAERR